MVTPHSPAGFDRDWTEILHRGAMCSLNYQSRQSTSQFELFGLVQALHIHRILARTCGEIDAALSTVATRAMLHHEGIELSRRMHQPQLFMA